MTGAFTLPPLRAIIDLHAELLAEHGGAPGLRDPGGLEAALARPHQISAYADRPPDLFALAAALGAGICRIHHPFVDGNKRAAFGSVGMVLLLNGVFLDAREHEAADQVLRLADGALGEESFADWLRRNCVSLASAGS